MSRDEAGVFGRYLLGHGIDPQTRALYARAVCDLHYDGDDAITHFAKKRPWSIGALDGALALTNSGALLRRKLLLMTAILEARPEYTDRFLPRERAPLDVLLVACAVARAGVLAAIGLLLLPFLR